MKVVARTEYFKVGMAFYFTLNVAALVFITLQSFYFQGAGAAFTYIGLLVFLALNFRQMEFGHEVSALTGFLVLMLMISSFFRILEGLSLKDFLSLVATVSMVLSMPMIYSIVLKRRQEMIFCLSAMILLHVSVLLFQAFYWSVTKEYFDILKLLSGVDSGSVGKKSVVLGGYVVPRFSGMFNEPGTYSVIIMSLVMAYYFGRDQVDKVVGLGVLSVLMTMSMFGVVLVGCFFLSMLVVKRRNINSLRVLIFGALVLTGFYFVGGVAAVTERLASHSDYGGVDFRVGMIQHFLADGNSLLVGVSIEAIPDGFVPNDAGLWFAFWYFFGLPGLLCFVAVALFSYYKSRRLDVAILVIAIFLTKIKFSNPILWFLIALVFAFTHKDRAHEKIIN